MRPQEPFSAQIPGIFGDIRSMLHHPSSHNWYQMMEVIEHCSPHMFTSTLMPYMLSMLETSRWQKIARNVPKRWLRELSEGEHVPWIRLCNTLKIHFKPKPYNRIFRALQQQPWLLDGLHSVHLSGELNCEHLAMVPGIKPRFRLKTLRIDSQVCDDEALANLLSQPITRGLKTLVFKGNVLGEHSTQMLGHTHHLQDVTCLVMQGTALTPERFSSLLQAPGSVHWRQLDLSSRQPGWDGMQCHRLTQHNHLHDEGLRLLSRATHMRHLEALCCSRSHITNRGLYHLSQAYHLRSLTHLDLSHSHGLTDNAIGLILSSPVFQNLETLNLSYCSLSSEGVARLNTAPQLPRLKELHITGNLQHIAHAMC